MDFDQTVDYLLRLGHETLTIKLGLKNTELLLEALGNPERTFASVQIAGTNGKGSTAVVLDSICRQAGIKTGLFTSPHLVSITERIKIDGVDIEPAEFARHATEVRDAADALLSSGKTDALPTFFEQVTAIAFLAFRRAQIDLAILETGLGGRLDSTSVARAETVGITQIALDHEEYLGGTIDSIAREKAAIIRPGSSVVIADNQTTEALDVIKRECERQVVTPKLGACRTVIEQTTADGRFCVTFETELSHYEKIWLGLRGRHQIDNVAVAIQLAESLSGRGFSIPWSAICDGVSAASHPARLELISEKPPFLLDGAHNPAGARSLRAYLDAFAARPLTLVFGAMRDKRLSEIAEILLPAADHVILTPVDNPRAAPVELLREIAEQHLSSKQITVASSSTAALAAAIASTSQDGMICVTGSLYLIGETRPAILQRAKRA